MESRMGFLFRKHNVVTTPGKQCRDGGSGGTTADDENVALRALRLSVSCCYRFVRYVRHLELIPEWMLRAIVVTGAVR